MKVYSDQFKLIYDPSDGEKEKWYINDHTIIKAEDGWHLFGITRQEPEAPLEEKYCAHAISKDLLTDKMTKLPFPLAAEEAEGEVHFWAPHVIKVDDTYYMYYCAGSLEGHDQYRIHLATSKDLYTWKKHPENPMLIDGFDARDPMILRINNEWVMYYTCNTSPSGGNHCVAAVHSDDLIHWSNKQNVFVDPEVGTYAGPCESPFVVKVEDWYFLFIGPRHDYSDTDVFAGKDPFDFRIENKVGNIRSHAAEVIQIDDRYYITRCGWGQGGVYLAPLTFELS